MPTTELSESAGKILDMAFESAQTVQRLIMHIRTGEISPSGWSFLLESAETMTSRIKQAEADYITSDADGSESANAN